MWYVVVCCKFRCIKEFSKSIMDGKCASWKEKYTFLRRQRIFICSDLEKYKYTPGDHKSAENIGSPGHYFLLPFIEMCVLTNDFPLVQVREGLPEGKGLFSKMDIPRYTFLCNYGGTLLSGRGRLYGSGVGISVIYMSSVLRRMGGAALSSIITPAKPYRWVSLSTTPDDTLMLCRGFFFVMMQSLRSCLFPSEKLLQARRSFLTTDACIKG